LALGFVESLNRRVRGVNAEDAEKINLLCAALVKLLL